VGALPLLEFTLDQLFQQRNDHQLSLSAYQKIGGVKGALAKQAEATYASLPSDEHRRLARVLFLRLIDVGTTEQDTTRPRARLAAGPPAEAGPANFPRGWCRRGNRPGSPGGCPPAGGGMAKEAV